MLDDSVGYCKAGQTDMLNTSQQERGDGEVDRELF
jgi:hypothetical protein